MLVVVEGSGDHVYGSIIGGTIVSATKIKPAIYIECGDRARGDYPSNRAGTITSYFDMTTCRVELKGFSK